MEFRVRKEAIQEDYYNHSFMVGLTWSFFHNPKTICVGLVFGTKIYNLELTLEDEEDEGEYERCCDGQGCVNCV